ncbi:GTPase [Rhodococcus sp. W8901]|uniref:GTPase n=1 Tax=Rhodococcus sp. W8901 TaxID=2742603 RepID=UPI001583B060|nr:GTPase [Rhodococcus sp. W8901]QKT10941.1 50S ribosome-binding GTPase [Rhodococcus sp. W8901]
MLDDLDVRIDALVDSFDQVLEPILVAGSGLADAVARITGGFGEELRGHLHRQRETLSTFNIAFFGRTGAGKSTLLSAFGELDGSYVSPGDSDWTTDVSKVDWRGCSLWDTPGINGWGRTQPRAELEATARRAVEVADVVLLCFDTQSQQPSEFAKVAAWIREFGKPAVAVLNVRNLRWRHPAKVPADTVRESLSKAVRDHVGNVRTELAMIGLGATPIVAVQSRRALFARASTPFQGPATSSFATDREKYGIDYLLRWSNFPVLEDLMAASIEEGGEELRRMALYEGLRGMFEGKAAELATLTDVVAQRSEYVETEVIKLLETLGYPEGESRVRWLGRTGSDALTQLEESRGRRFTASADGRLDRHLRDLIKAHLAHPRQAALGRADALVDTVFVEDKHIDDTAFADAVYVEAEVRDAAIEVWKSAAGFLERELRLATGEVVPAVALSKEATSFGGGAGRVKKQIARGVQAAGLAAGAAAGVVVLPAVANAWNPAGWVGGVAAIGLGALAQVGQMAGSRAASSGESDRVRARAEAIRAARTATHQTFDEIERNLLAQCRELAWEAGAPVLRDRVKDVLALHRQRCGLGGLADRLAEESRKLPRVTGAAEVLVRAQSEVLARRSDEPTPDVDPGSSRARQVWLGEDWIGESAYHSHDQAHGESDLALAAAEDADRGELRSAVLRAWNPDSLDSVTSMVHRIGQFLDNNALTIQCSHRDVLVDDSKPSIAIMGDYSSGKSSLVKRLLIELNDEVPEDILIRGDAATGATRAYDLGSVRVIDTPGFQSSNTEHARRALDVVAGAALVVVVLHVNLLIGDVSLLDSIVNGSSENAAKAERTIYLINRADELGVAPDEASSDFLLLKTRKEEELIAALASRGIFVAPEQVHTLAGDPYGHVATETDVVRSSFDHHRDWDGVRPLIQMFESLSSGQVRAGVAAGQLDRAWGELLQAKATASEVVNDALAHAVEHANVLQAIGNGVADSSTLDATIRARVWSAVEPYMARAHADSHAVDAGKMGDLESTANSWWLDDTLAADLDRVLVDSQRDIEDWYRIHASTIGRELAGLGFSRSAYTQEERVKVANAADVKGMKVVGHAAGGGAKLVKMVAKRDVVYQVGKAVGVKFKPWGAVNAAGKIGKAAPVLAAVNVAADGYAMVRGEMAANDRERQRDAAAAFIKRTSEDVVNHVLEGETANGPAAVLRDLVAELSQRRQEVEREVEAFQAVARTHRDLIADIDILLADAEELRREKWGINT